MLGGVPDFLGGVPGFLEGVPDFWEGVPGFLGCSGIFGGVPGFWVLPDVPGCSVFRFSGVPVFLEVLHAVVKSVLLLFKSIHRLI